jgi:hypothetical protein
VREFLNITATLIRVDRLAAIIVSVPDDQLIESVISSLRLEIERRRGNQLPGMENRKEVKMTSHFVEQMIFLYFR